MANRRTGSNQQNARSRLASFLLVLLPGFMFLGLLAPAAVSVEYEGEEETIVPVSFRNFRLTRQPLVSSGAVGIARGASAIQEALVTGVRFIAQGAKRALDLPTPQGDHDEQTILLEAESDAVKTYENKKLFNGTIAGPVLSVDLTPVWSEDLFDIIPHPLRRWGFAMDDDFPGNGVAASGPLARPVPVPEPGTAALLGLGLALLALRRKRR